MEWRSLSYVFSNYLTELEEQRRKFGRIKQRDNQSGAVIGELDPFGVDYLCFFIEAHNALLTRSNKHRNALFFMHYVMEDYLRKSFNGEISSSAVKVTPDIINSKEIGVSKLIPMRVAKWMFHNYGFTANRNELA
jgi:hypothetical protein